MTNNSVLKKHDLGAAAVGSDEFAVIDTGFCTLCGEKSASKCDRCGDFYCSAFCQRRDWQNHRYICFPMPKLVKAVQETVVVRDEPEPQTAAKSSRNSSMPPSGSCVLLTGFKSTNRCYIRSTNPSTVAEYDRVLNEINDFGKNSTAVLSDNPKLNSYALALRGEKWCRVQIMGNRKDNCFRIFFVDFGDVSKRFLKDLRQIPPSLANLPNFIHMVQLKGIKKFSIETKLLQSLAKYTNKEYKVEFVQPDEAGGHVELYQWENNTLLNSLILASMSKQIDNGKEMEHVSVTSSLSNDNDVQKNGFGKSVTNEDTNKKEVQTKASIAQNKAESYVSESLSSVNHSAKKRGPPRQIQMQKPCLQPPFEIIPLNEKADNIKILIVDDTYAGSGYIGCLLEQYCENLTAVSKFLQDYKIIDQGYKPKFNEYCLAMFENDWYRAKVVEILSDDKFLVVYIDFTNEMELTSRSIRRYPMSLTLPCYTTLCALDGLPEDISDELKNFLELNCKSFSHLNIDTVRVVDDIRYVKSKELLNKMRNSKLL
ncbi:uncharacterized protein Veneno [Calliphora vicina]|uniref:uncharacterized protein Veneno n=1 Tax=Calliphora vicina TaxID=7373 RepID=UPI00325B69DC